MNRTWLLAPVAMLAACDDVPRLQSDKRVRELAASEAVNQMSRPMMEQMDQQYQIAELKRRLAAMEYENRYWAVALDHLCNQAGGCPKPKSLGAPKN